MIDTKEYSEAVVEVLDIMKHMDEEYIQKIPLDFIKNLNSKKSTTYSSNIDFTKPLEENELRNSTKVILTIIYRDYICTDEEKEELEKMLEEAEKLKYEKYKTNLFENKNEKSEENIEHELKLVPVEEKKNFFQKLLDKLFNINRKPEI